MKKIITFCAAILMSAGSFAQAPQKMSYQAVIRNSSDALVTSTQVGMQISILQGSSTGTAVYVETQTPITNINGLASLEIGMGTPVQGTMAGIDWSEGPYFIKTETDPLGGTDYTISGTSELMSVPYALFSANGTPGPAGETGQAGPAGTNGINGINGIDGIDGAQGVQGIPGPAGETGQVGPAGTNGINGIDGIDGIDGAQGLQGIPGAANISGTNNYVIKFTGATTGGNSQLFDDGTNVGIGTITPSKKLEVNGDALINGVTVGRGTGNISSNTVTGKGALFSNTTGFYNTANGDSALFSNTIGYANTAYGYKSLYSNINATSNTAYGSNSLYSLTTGGGNVANGTQTLRDNTTGYYNTANGFAALNKNTTGYSNTANGDAALGFNTTGYQNTADGDATLLTNTTGSNNTALGFSANVSAGNLTNATAIGANAYVGASNSLVLGSINGVNDATANTNVGIGTTTPSANLDVVGTVKITDGTEGAGKVLTSDASGNASWQTAGVHYIGESYGGGIVYYVYDGGRHGLIAATADHSTPIQWYNGISKFTGAQGDGMGAGEMNTAILVATQMADNQTGNFAAKVCANYSVTVDGVNYGDWYLPSIHELNLLYLQQTVVGGLTNSAYWSSTESQVYFNSPWILFVPSGVLNNGDWGSWEELYVRAVRAF